MQGREGWRETGLAGPPVPGSHPNQSVQVAGVCLWEVLVDAR